MIKFKYIKGGIIMKKVKSLFILVSILCILSVVGFKVYASELNRPTKTNNVINYRYTGEVYDEGLGAENFNAPKQLTINHYVDSAVGKYELFMQERYFNTNIGFRFYPKDHYYPFNRFTETDGIGHNDLSSDNDFYIDKNYTGPLTINYYYTAELTRSELDVDNFEEPEQLTVNHYLDGGYNEQTMQLFMQETYFNLNANFKFYPEDHYYPFGKFTEVTDRGSNDLSTDDPFWAKSE